jgi:hypothetical protein
MNSIRLMAIASLLDDVEAFPAFRGILTQATKCLRDIAVEVERRERVTLADARVADDALAKLPEWLKKDWSLTQ